MFCEPLIFTHLRSQQPKTYGQPWSYTNVSASYICTQKYLPKGLQNSTLFFIAHQKVLSQTKDYSNFKSWCPKLPKNHINCPTSNFLKIFRRSINGIQTRDCYKIILLGVGPLNHNSYNLTAKFIVMWITNQSACVQQTNVPGV